LAATCLDKNRDKNNFLTQLKQEKIKKVVIIGSSGFISNQTVIKFIAYNPNIGFGITSVSPVGVMGKSLSTRQDSTSTGIQFLFKNKIAPNPFIQMFYGNDIFWAVVDVTDVATINMALNMPARLRTIRI